MTNLINQITINGEPTTFLNYVNPVGMEALGFGATNWLTSALTQQYGNVRTVWTQNGTFYAIRFPVGWETLTGNITAAGSTSLGAGTRTTLSTRRDFFATNSTSGTGLTQTPLGRDGNEDYPTSFPYAFGVFNKYCAIYAGFSNATRSTCTFRWVGWPKDRVYTGTAYPRNFVGLSVVNSIGGTNYFDRVLLENTNVNNYTNTRALLLQNPTLSCAVSTPGANATDILARDSVSPNNYLGKLWNVIILPSSAVVGKIYKNTGVDPDTGNIETDQKAFWVCVGSFGTDKIGMRVWTENIT